MKLGGGIEGSARTETQAVPISPDPRLHLFTEEGFTMMGMGFGLGGLGLIFMFIFWIVIIALAVWFLSTLFPRVSNQASNPSQPGSQQTQASESPLEVLQRRYARGEITKAEYEQIRRDLGI